jgi:hypothetical protein
MKNTKEQAQFRFIMYKRPQNKNFVGICLDLDIVEEDEDPVRLRKSLEEAAQGYLEAVWKNDLNAELLNKQIPLKYRKIVEELENYLHQLHQRSLPKNNFPLQDGQFFTKSVNDLACV